MKSCGQKSCRENSLRVLPSAFSLVGTNHLPPIDNQGGIGSCASQAITYMQFTNGYSRYLQSCGVDPNRCPKENESARFAPKFTYNFSGAGTSWVYEVLRDHGCLPLDECSFEKDAKGASQKIVDGNLSKKTASWPVKPGQMRDAMMNRVKNWEQIWITKPPYNETLTTTDEGKGLLRKIKASLVEGNAVVTGGYPARWMFGKICASGTYGKPGDSAVIAAAGNAGGGHQVTIVGYDDEIAAELNGVTMKGAFIIANSYGTTWQNSGYVFMMYDAVNTVSAFESLNDPRLYSGPMYVTPGRQNCMYSEFLAHSNQTLSFRKAGERELCGEVYPVYDIYDAKTGSYLSYSSDKADRSVSSVNEASDTTKWVAVPYEALAKWEGFAEKEYKKEYEGSYWLWAVEKGDEPVGGARFLDAGVSYSAMGRGIGLATLNSGRYPHAKSWTLEAAPGEDFESKLGIAAGKDEKSERIWALDQVCFTDWRQDYVREMPALLAEIEIEAKDRNGFFITMTRTGRDGSKESYMLPLFRFNEYHPGYCKKEETITFSGKVNGKAECGQFALSYAELLKLPEGRDLTDYTWGFEVKVKDGEEVTVKKAALCFGGSKTPLKVLDKEKIVTKKASFKF